MRKAHKFAGTPVALDDLPTAAGFEPLLPDYVPEGFEVKYRIWSAGEESEANVE